jgi:colicin import membrane protein
MLAILIHGLIVGSLLILQRADTEALNVVRPPAIKALLVQENPQARNEQVQQQRTQQQSQEQARQEQARQEQARQEQATQEQARQEQARQEQARQDLAAREQAAQQEEQRLTAVRQQREREQQAEQQRQQEVARQQEVVQQQEQQRQQEAQRLEQQQQENAAAAADAREVAVTESEIAMAYMGVIHDLVQRNWSRPPSARNNMTAVLRIRLVPTGDVVDVEIVTSSGDAAFDRAAENAVRAVGRFSELRDMPPRMFERNFRSVLLTFRPEDLLN